MTRNYGRGFTVVELMVTITVLLILTTLAVIRLQLTQAGGRDQERTIDATAIAAGLETYYQDGNAASSIPKGYYPGATQVLSAAATSPPFTGFLNGVPGSSFLAPLRTTTDSFGVDPNYATAAIGEKPDGSYADSRVLTLLASYPYLYQPLQRNNAFCTNYTNCVKFNLYYLQEGQSGTNTFVQIRSKNQ